jgi:hypothetical protein
MGDVQFIYRTPIFNQSLSETTGFVLIGLGGNFFPYNMFHALFTIWGILNSDF